MISVKMRKNCRIWWPKQTLSCESLSSSSAILFGWFIASSSTSLDIVVAFSINEVLLSQIESDLQGIVDRVHLNMPASLSEKSAFSVLGCCGAKVCSNGVLPGTTIEEDDQTSWKSGKMGYQCCKLKGLLKQCRLGSIKHHNWVQLDYDCRECYPRHIHEFPKLHHVHWNGEMVSDCDVHVIVYETPRFGSHYLSLGFLNSYNLVKTLKKPVWIDELHKKQPLLELDLVIFAINCANATNIIFQRHLGPEKPVNRFMTFTYQLLSVSIASVSTVFYVILHCLHYSLFGYKYQLWVYAILERVFSNTLKNVQIRCSQLLYWPIVLQENVTRSQSCVEFAEKASLHKHSMWSSLAVDILIGNWVGFIVLCHSKYICLWFSNIVNDTTNNFLRVGCVWLMGVPAGFKLNTEMATIFGIICLNAIQFWSTLGFFTSFLFSHFLRGLAISGMVFGVTIPAALIKDITMLLTAHISALHWLLSNLYSRQIQALAALWRLFRGQKWNPLRQRLDSYDYTVEQHIVGSLLFTPLLLLLPTTSVFYIFFSLVNNTISVISILIEVTISLLHATPYIKIVFWLMKRGRFPCGIWFELISFQSNTIEPSDEFCTFDNSEQKNGIREEGSWYLALALHNNCFNIGQVVFPHFKDVFSGVSRSLVLSSARGVFTGKRFPSSLGTGLPSKLPWKYIPYKKYWFLCHDSVASCMKNHDSHYLSD